jgi:hypothetical protein
MRRVIYSLLWLGVILSLLSLGFLHTVKANPGLPNQENENLAAKPTRTPRPTSTPVPIPPPAEPLSLNLMILFGALAVLVVFIGVWINRKKPTSKKDADL